MLSAVTSAKEFSHEGVEQFGGGNFVGRRWVELGVGVDEADGLGVGSKTC